MRAIISMLANNDAGGMLEYTLSGAHFGMIFIPLLFLLAPISYIFSELIMRLGIATGKTHHELVRLHIGKIAANFSICAMVVGNFLYIITEFIGMATPLVFFGLPLWIASLISLVFVCAIALFWSEKRQDKIAMCVGGINVVFIVVAIMGFNAGHIGNLESVLGGMGGFENSLWLFILATIGNTIAPFMLFFQQSDISTKQEIWLGALLQSFFAAIVIVCGASLLGAGAGVGDDVPSLIGAFAEYISPVAGALFAVGLFNSGWLAAITISLATTRTIYVRGHHASGFVTTLIFLVLGAGFILIPCVPLGLVAVGTQIVGAILLVPDLVYIAILTSKRGIMGAKVNTRWQRVLAWGLAGLFGVVAACFLLTI
ncbi:hypothetical protein FACS189425_01930 [Clostridia bacterium]|nr:hypothetical protein FACS189425_01930 [Clostridia bacterium]